MTAIRTLVVEDEKPARERLRRLLEQDARVDLAGCHASGTDAVRAVRAAARTDTPVQLLFLDVQMPELDGFGVLAALAGTDPMPAVVFITAHDEHAIRAFDVHAIDYLLKPFSDERFEAALDRAASRLRAGRAEALLSQLQALLGNAAAASTTPSSASSPSLDRIVLKSADRIRLLPVHQITWIEAAGVYVKLHLRDGSEHLHRSLLGQLDTTLDRRQFVRVHRSAIVNLDLVDALRPDPHGDFVVLLKDGTAIPLGRTYRSRLQERLGQGL